MTDNNITPFASFIDELWIQDWDNIILCDIDGTIFRDSFFLYIFNGLVNITWRYEYLSIHDEYMKKWKDREIPYDEYLGNIIPLFIELVRGVKQKDFEEICFNAVEEYNNRTYIFTKNYLKSKQKEWYKVFFISGSPFEVVKYFSDKNNFNWAIGSYYLSEDGKKTGERIPLFSNDAKSSVLKYIRYKYRNVTITWIGDTNWDYSLITQSDYWMAINPARELAEKLIHNKDSINSNNISIIIERKDVNVLLDIDTLSKTLL